MSRLSIEVAPAGRLAARGAELVAGTLRAAVAARGRATVAFSGGSTAGPLFQALAELSGAVGATREALGPPGDPASPADAVPWSALDVLQVDERVAPDGHPDRNLTTLRRRLLDHVPLPPEHLHPMSVDDADLEGAAARYATILHDVAGRPPTLDLVHLGLGADGHTASLVPGLPALASDAGAAGPPGPVIVTPPYEGRRRMTLTLPVLSRARTVLWFVAGADKAPAVRRLVEGDRSIPAGNVEAPRSLLLLDPAAAAELPPSAISGPESRKA